MQHWNNIYYLTLTLRRLKEKQLEIKPTLCDQCFSVPITIMKMPVPQNTGCPEIIKIFFYYCACQSKSETKLKPELSRQYFNLQQSNENVHHIIILLLLLVIFYFWLKPEDLAARSILHAWISLPSQAAAIMYETDQSLSKTRLILGGISNSIRPWTLGTECRIHITD